MGIFARFIPGGMKIRTAADREIVPLLLCEAMQYEFNINKNMKNITDTKPVVTKEEITLAAYQIWEKAGRSSGRDLEFWLAAEKQILAARNTNAQAPKRTKAAPLLVSARRSTASKATKPSAAKTPASRSKSGKKNSKA